TVAEFRYDGRFWGAADGGDLLSQLMDGGRDARPDVEAAWFSRRSLYRSEQRLDDIVDIDEIAHDPTVFVDLQRALLARPTREESDYSGVRIGQRLARPVDILQPQHTEIGVMRGRPRPQHVLLRQLGRGVNVGRPRLRPASTARKRHPRFTRGPLGIPDTSQQLSVAARPRIEGVCAASPSALAVDGP